MNEDIKYPTLAVILAGAESYFSWIEIDHQRYQLRFAYPILCGLAQADAESWPVRIQDFPEGWKLVWGSYVLSLSRRVPWSDHEP